MTWQKQGMSACYGRLTATVKQCPQRIAQRVPHFTNYDGWVTSVGVKANLEALRYLIGKFDGHGSTSSSSRRSSLRSVLLSELARTSCVSRGV